MKNQTFSPNPLSPSGKEICTDHRFAGPTVKGSFNNYVFHRLVAKEVTFEEVDFSYTIFDTCYVRKCHFQNCNFTGCRFASSNFHGSTFTGCKFDYAVFERTIVEPEILDLCCPGAENLRSKFARTLRTNFQALGDAASVNKAINVELDATREHLWKGWHSRESYYRSKYRGWSRVMMLFKWINFKVWDYVWGNGESFWKLFRAFAVILIIMSVAHVSLTATSPILLKNYFESLYHAPAVLFGIDSPPKYPQLYLAGILFVRLVLVGFFLSIVIKRFGRR